MNEVSENTAQDKAKFSVIISDDHEIVRLGLKKVLEVSDTFCVVGECENADDTIKAVSELQPDLLVLDLGLPQKSGLEVLYALREKNIPTKVVVFTRHDEELMVKQAIAAGAVGYVLKDFETDDLLESLDICAKGGSVYPEQFEHLSGSEAENLGSENSLLNSADADPLHKLSKREREVFFLIAEGLPNRVIAKNLYISPRTVETHRARVIKKLGANSTADLIRFAIKNNLLTP